MRIILILAVSLLTIGCSTTPATSDGGTKACDAGPSGNLAGFCAPIDPGGGGILFAASGEVLALTGYPFPPVTDGDPAFVDGWDVKFTRLLVTVDKIKLAENPDLNPGDESQTGMTVAEVDGPWAIDLSHADPSYLPGKGGGGEEAVPIAMLKSQNLNGNQPFATDGSRYAFGFDLIAATTTTSHGRATMNVNLDAAGLSDYANMITNGCAVYYVGTATFKGDQGPIPTCNADPEYATWPKTITFNLCFKSPTSYVNCQNPDNDPATPLANEEHERGIAFLANESVIGQVTVHTDHPFWDSVLPSRFTRALRSVRCAVERSSRCRCAARDARSHQRRRLLRVHGRAEQRTSMALLHRAADGCPSKAHWPHVVRSAERAAFFGRSVGGPTRLRGLLDL